MQRTDAAEVRRHVLDHIRPVESAWSVNGRDIEFMGDLGMGVRNGGFITVTPTDGRRLLVQIHDLRIGSRDAVRVDIDPDQLGLDEGVIRSADVRLLARLLEGSGRVIAELGGGASGTGGFDHATIEPSDDDDIRAYLTDSLGDRAGLTIGRLRGSDVEARLKATGFARHTFLVGQSGSGKTFSLGVVLERLLLETDLRVVIVDPNSDYVNLGSLTSRAAVNRYRSSPLSRDEYDELKRRYAERSDVAVASSRRGDLPLTIHLSDLTPDEQGLVLRIDPLEDADEFSALQHVAKSIPAPYGPGEFRDVLLGRFDEPSRRLAQRIENLRIAEWSIWAGRDELSLAQSGGAGHRVTILDTGSLADARERSVVALALLGRLRRRPEREPVSVVIDEAHNVCPPESSSRLERAVTEHALWIAGEGRKFGIYLLLSTQRPQKIHRNVISQCDNLLLMRVNSTTDLDQIAEVFSHVPPSLIAEAKSHQMGEMLAAGPVAPTPLRLQVAERWTKEGGADLPTTWAAPRV